jgi:NitT/TauT family transport system substrate-binding protein
MKKLILETTAPFQGLAELVADREGLFEKEGITIEWVDREKGVDKTVQKDVTTPEGVNPFASHGKLFEEGKADMYNACEWGNYCRVQDTSQGGRQLGRRAIVCFAGLYVRPDSEVYTAQQLVDKDVGAPFYFGTHYLILHMVEGFMKRDQIKLVRAPNGSRYRYEALVAGEYEATCLTEPYASLAEKEGCRLITSSFLHGTEVASDKVDTKTYTKFNRAVREAVRRINADRSAYMHYFLDYYKDKDPRIAAMDVSDLIESRVVVVDPAPIPQEEADRTAAWIKSWGMLAETDEAAELINMEVQQGAHAAAE